jgi:hypothetical protein
MSYARGSSVRSARRPAGDGLRVSHLEILRKGAKAFDAMETFRCTHCGETIGVYEPLVMCTEGAVRTTSRAAEPNMIATGATHYHRDCYTAEVEWV